MKIIFYIKKVFYKHTWMAYYPAVFIYAGSVVYFFNYDVLKSAAFFVMDIALTISMHFALPARIAELKMFEDGYDPYTTPYIDELGFITGRLAFAAFTASGFSLFAFLCLIFFRFFFRFTIRHEARKDLSWDATMRCIN